MTTKTVFVDMGKENKTYKVLLSDTQYYWVDVEAESEEEAEKLVSASINDGETLDTYEAGERDYAGYEVQEGCAELVD